MSMSTLNNIVNNKMLSQRVGYGPKNNALDIKHYYYSTQLSQATFKDGLKSPTPSTCSSPSLSPSSTPSSTKQTRHFSFGSATSASGYDFVIKVILLGDQGVGKSSYLKALKVHPELAKVQCQCRASHLCDHLEVEVVTSSGKLALVKLCDTGGQERYRSLTSSYYRGAHGAILMLSLTCEQSLGNVEEWLSDLDTFCSESSCSRVLLGSNCTDTSRSVRTEQARAFADSRAMPYMEIDANHFYNVVESIQLIVDRIVRDVTISNTKSQVIKPQFHSGEEKRNEGKFVCLC